MEDVALLVRNASTDHTDTDLTNARDQVASAAVRRLASGALDARLLTSACLAACPSSASIILLEAVRALVPALASKNNDPATASSREARLIQKDTVAALCLVIQSALDAGAARLDVKDTALLEIVELAGRAGLVVKHLVLAAVERAWLSYSALDSENVTPT